MHDMNEYIKSMKKNTIIVNDKIFQEIFSRNSFFHCGWIHRNFIFFLLWMTIQQIMSFRIKCEQNCLRNSPLPMLLLYLTCSCLYFHACLVYIMCHGKNGLNITCNPQTVLLRSDCASAV